MIIIAAAFQGSADSTRAAAPPAGQESKAKAEPRPSQKAVLVEATVLKRDMAYGEDEKQRLDVYSPQGSKEAPVVVFVHGGEWTKGDKSEVSYKPKFLNENGIVFVSVNYRLAPAATHPAQINDLAAAVRWVRDHAAECGASPDKIVLMGHSAGCHLVTLLALDPRYLAGVKLRPNQLARGRCLERRGLRPGPEGRGRWHVRSLHTAGVRPVAVRLAGRVAGRACGRRPPPTSFPVRFRGTRQRLPQGRGASGRLDPGRQRPSGFSTPGKPEPFYGEPSSRRSGGHHRRPAS